jgi:hypothetical protein
MDVPSEAPIPFTPPVLKVDSMVASPHAGETPKNKKIPKTKMLKRFIKLSSLKVTF